MFKLSLATAAAALTLALSAPSFAADVDASGSVAAPSSPAMSVPAPAINGSVGVQSDQSAQMPGAAPAVPFDNGVRTNQAQPTTCSPADSTCGSGIGNPSVQSPVQKRELNASPQ